jgi:hypothetical protein
MDRNLLLTWVEDSPLSGAVKVPEERRCQSWPLTVTGSRPGTTAAAGTPRVEPVGRLRMGLDPEHHLGSSMGDVVRRRQRHRMGAGPAVVQRRGLRGRRGNVIAPATERARSIASPAPHAAKVAHETSPASRQSATVKHGGSQTAHEKARVTHARTTEPAVSIAKPATPVRERHNAPAPRVEAVRPPHVTSSASQAPPPEAAPQGEKHKPDAAPPQGGKAHAPKNEHGREKAE